MTVNHRLGIFGYLQLAHLDPAEGAAGNAGTLDLVAALEWVRDNNIAHFGGDPGKRDDLGRVRGRRQGVLADRMSGAWLAFALHGDPNHDGLADWPPYDLDARPTMIFDRGSCHVEDDPWGGERLAWPRPR